MKPFARLLAPVAAIAGIAVAATALHAREVNYQLPRVTDRLLYLRSGHAANRLALSFDALAADIYWIRTIQHYGRDHKNRSRTGRFELLESLLDLTTTLDPHFLIAYRFGAIFLALAPPDGPGRPDRALALLEKGLAANPDKWQLAHDIAFTHYLYTGKYDTAAEWFKRAAVMPGAPEWIGPLAAATVAQGGNREGARRMLSELRTSNEDYIRRAADRTLAQLSALDQIDAVEQQVELYRSRVGREPSGWRELIDARVIPGIPVDPSGVPLVYDPASKKVVLSPESPLMPLPPMLLRK